MTARAAEVHGGCKVARREAKASGYVYQAC